MNQNRAGFREKPFRRSCSPDRFRMARRRWQPGSGVLIVACLATLTGCQVQAQANHDKKVVVPPANALNAQPDKASALEVVLAAPVARKTLTLYSTQPARLEPIAQSPIHSKLSAYVEEVNADFGDHVTADQPLLTLRVPELQLEARQREALVHEATSVQHQAEAAKRAAEAAVITARSQRSEVEAGIARAAADVRRWQSEFTRFERLAAEGAVDRKLVDETQQKLQSAGSAQQEVQAHAATAAALVAEAEAKVAQREADILAAQAALQVAQVNFELARTMLNYAIVRAPFDGIVTHRNVDPGHYVQPSGTSGSALFMITRTDKIRVMIAVPELDSGFVDEGDEAVIEVQALGGASFRGQVSRTSFSLDEDNRALLTIIDLPNPDGRLRPGMYAVAKLKLDERANVIAVAPAAITRQGAEAFVFRLVDGKAVRTPIQLGIRVADEYEVAKGLSDNDTVILNKAASLQDGQEVRVAQPEKK